MTKQEFKVLQNEIRSADKKVQKLMNKQMSLKDSTKKAENFKLCNAACDGLRLLTDKDDQLNKLFEKVAKKSSEHGQEK